MKLRIGNFGKIKSADIVWDGLTVIAGRNDTGKSTIGKLFFAINKVLADYPNIFLKEVGTTVTEIGNVAIERCLRMPDRNKLFLPDLIARMERFMTDVKLRSINFLEKSPEVDSFILPLLRDIFLALPEDNELRSLLTHCLMPLENTPTRENMFDVAQGFVLAQVFSGKLNNSLHVDISGEIEFSLVGERENLRITCKNNAITTDFAEISEKNPFFRDVTFVETPFVVDERFQKNSAFLFTAWDDLHLKLNRIKQGGLALNSETYSGHFRKALGNVSFLVDKERQCFLYKVDPEAEPIPLMDIASGAKMWGLLTLLLQANLVNPDAPLILDEPENHLHPEWQIVFAKFIALLVKNGIRVLLTSHSPTFIHALIKSSLGEDGFVSGTHFYLAEDVGDNFSVIRDVTDSTHEIFKDLSAPVERLWQED